jgi:transcriptional regulator with XRE-family HTH domain
MTRETDERLPRKPKDRKPSRAERMVSDDPAYYEGLGRAIKVARTERGLSRRDLADAAGVSYAYLSDIETGRGRPGSRSFLAIAEAMLLSPSTLMREAERYRAQIGGEEAPPQPQPPAPGGLPRDEIQARMARMSEAAPSPAARRWFHAGRMLAEAERDLAAEESEVHLGGLGDSRGDETSLEELHLLVDDLSPEDAAVVLALVRRLRSAG